MSPSSPSPLHFLRGKQADRRRSSAVTASSLYLSRYNKTNPSLLAKSSSSPSVIQPCYIDPSATIAPSAKIGPNVAIGPFVNVGEGVRVKDAIVMEGSTLEKHACVLNSIVGTNCTIGPWARVDGLPEPEQDTKQISVTVLATEVTLAPETLVRSCIVLPNVSGVDRSSCPLYLRYPLHLRCVLVRTLEPVHASSVPSPP